MLQRIVNESEKEWKQFHNPKELAVNKGLIRDYRKTYNSQFLKERTERFISFDLL